MAFGSRSNPALIGRPSLRRQLAGLSSDRQAMFEAMNADVDPRRFKSLYRRNAEAFLSNERTDGFEMSRQARQMDEERRRSLYRTRNFGRSPNEILGE